MMVVYFHIVEIVYITISYRQGKCNPDSDFCQCGCAAEYACNLL